MPALTLSLNRLVELFARSVNNDKLPIEIRSFSAKLMTLTAHVIRIDGSAGKAFTAVNKQLTNINTQIAQMTEIVTVLAAKLGIEAPATATPSAPTAAPSVAPTTPAQPRPAAPAAAAPVQAAPAATEETDEDEEAAAVARFVAEAQDEVDAINGVAEVTQ